MNGNASDSSSQVVYEFVRASVVEGWWIWAAMIAATAAAFWLGITWYRRDVKELSRPVRWTLMAMRLITAVAVIFFFFDLQRRTERFLTRPSEVVMLLDTSQSMSLPADPQDRLKSRIDRASELVTESTVVDQFSNSHRVSVYAFDRDDQPRLLHTSGEDLGDPMADDEPDPTSKKTPAGAANPADSSLNASNRINPFAAFGVFCLAGGVIGVCVAMLLGVIGRGRKAGWPILAAATCLVVGTISLGVVYAVETQHSLAEILGRSADESSDDEPARSDSSDADSPDNSKSGETKSGDVQTPTGVADWKEQIVASGGQSRIGDAVRSVLADHDSSTLAGIVLVTDGQNNGGTDTSAAASAARRVGVAVYPIGLGSDKAPPNVKVMDVDAPKRVYPGDKFAVNAALQASGGKPITAEVQLIDGLDTSASGDEAPAGEVVDSQKVELQGDGTITGIRFELEPKTVGKRRLSVRVVASEDDQNAADNVARARYEVVARKLKILAVAGGPTREYRFVRNLFHRDKSITLDVWLQTGQPGMSQDADKLLTAFPATADDLFEYDAIVMFDPDWTAISITELDLVDRWMAEQAGGLVIVAGPVYHNKWTRLRTDPRVSRIAGFFPVNVSTRGPLLGGGRQGGRNAWPIKFSPESRRAEFLWIEDDAETSFEIWNEFGGIYDFVGVKDAKPGASVYGRFSDPTADIGDGLPIYLASQFYGSGRVMFQGSGEMWRLRGQSDSYFDSYYTKLIRWVSEGRLLRDSNRGVLRVESPRAMVGDTLTVRAILSDDQFRPLTVPQVEAKLLAPTGQSRDLILKPVPGETRGGVYSGRFVVRQPGDYEIRLSLGGALSTEILRQSVAVRLPTLEMERPVRADPDLQQLAKVTGGTFLPVDMTVTSEAVTEQLTKLIQPQPQTTLLSGTPDRSFTQRRNAVLMWLIALTLTIEWTVRRLHRLA